MNILGSYRNGNYNILIFSDGTKIKYNNEKTFIPDTIESFDCKITNMCDLQCKFCHENSVPNGKHADLGNIRFFETLHPFTEIAIGGGNPLSHPQLIEFLEKCKRQKLIPNLTVNQIHFIKNFELVKELIEKKLIYGVGISFVNANDELIEKTRMLKNSVIHVINGIVSLKDLEKLAFNNLKILILGYKEIRRGEALYKNNQQEIEGRKDELKNNLYKILKENWFSVVSLDNLAINQLEPKKFIPKENWDMMFMGDDGVEGEFNSASMFIDLVEGTFSRNSCSNKRYKLLDNIKDMYKVLKDENELQNK